MNSANLKKVVPGSDRCRVALTLSLSLLVSFSLIPAAAQQKTHKRITSVWTATSAEGSRVHVDSDFPVNNYEAYTRGDRFYVQIPLADLPSARGSLLGRGFDDVQIQRYGDGIIISFHLQPGTTARVEQNSNRLEIVFSTLGKHPRTTSASESANRIKSKRVADAAGSAPSSSPGAQLPASSEGSSSANTGAAAGAILSASKEVATSTSPLPSASATVSASPGTAESGSAVSVSPNETATSIATPQPSTVTSPEPVSASVDNSWASKRHYWKVWVQLNWLPLLIGGVIGLALLVLLVSLRRTKRRKGHEVEAMAQTNSPEAPAPAQGLPIKTSALQPEAKAAAASVGTPSLRASATQTQAAARSTASAANSSDSAPDEKEKPAGQDEEREVFEL